MTKQKIVFCRGGVIAEFYKALVRTYIFPKNAPNIDVTSYGTATNSLGFPKYYLSSKYGSLLKGKETEFEVFLCYDKESVIFNQISSECWKDIGNDLLETFDNISVTHIVHVNSIEDWFLADIDGLSSLFNRKIDFPNTSGREFIKKYYQDNERTYVSSNESQCKELISMLNIKKIIEANMCTLIPLLKTDKFCEK
ncbi:MAG: hypothetical protein LBD23_03250 [Oscillospiraceae bacterium]|jgi:hypothetical protein|nr:hypothetical protein [Oscillospiraceae bacterium]